MQMEKREEIEFAALVGLDWSEEKHDIKLCDLTNGNRVESVKIGNTPEEIEEWVLSLRERFNGGYIGICLEQSKGMLINKLLMYDFVVLYPINPAVSAKYREAFFPSKAKNDPVDAELLLELVVKHRNRLTAWRPDSEQIRALEILTENRRQLVEERKSCVQRLQSVLKKYYPQAIEMCGGDLSKEMACAFLMKYESIATLKKARPQTLRKFYYSYNCRSEEAILRRLEIHKNLKEVTDEAFIIKSYILAVKGLVKQIRSLNKSIEEHEKEIASIYDGLEDAEVFNSFPGAGEVIAPRLLVAFGSQRDKYPTPASIQNYSGISPVTEKSGKNEWIHHRWRCPTFLKQSFHEYAQHSVGKSVWATNYYELKKKEGKKHNTIIRSLAYKWQRIMHKCWQDKTPYDEQKYLRHLQKKGSPYAPKIAA